MRSTLLALVAVLCAGCATEYSYTPPAGKSGQRCVERCVQRQLDCRAAETDRAASSNAQCERDAETEQNACLRYADDRKKCVKKGCYDFAATGQCDVDYRACYQNCGGKVEILKQ